METKEIMKMRNSNKVDSLTNCNTRPLPRVGLYVDYPNLYATMKGKGSSPELDKLLAVSRSLGDLIFAKCYITIYSDSYNPSILGLERIGYTVIPRFVPDTDYGKRKDIDTFLAVDAVSDLLINNVDILIIASNDSDFLPVMKVARENGKIAVAMVSSHDEAKLLSESATVYIEGMWNESIQGSAENGETEVQMVQEAFQW